MYEIMRRCQCACVETTDDFTSINSSLIRPAKALDMKQSVDVERASVTLVTVAELAEIRQRIAQRALEQTMLAGTIFA